MFLQSLEMKFWRAVALVNVGRIDESLPLFRQVFARDRNWATQDFSTYKLNGELN